MLKLQIFDQTEIKRIHTATIQVLANTGVRLTHQQGRKLLLENGASVKGDRVVLPEELIEKCIAIIPPRVKLQGRDPDKSIDLSRGTFYAHNVGGVPNLFDTKNQSRRPATREDNIQAARLMDALPNVASVTPLFTPQDVPGVEMSLWMTIDTVANTTKPFRSPGMQTGDEVRALGEMIQIACPDGTITVGVSPVSPLSFPDSITEAIIEVARQGFILGPLPCPILGATAPMSIAGGLVQQNAEVLASIVLAQTVRPGTPIIYKGRLSVMNPFSGLSVWGNPEIGLISAAAVQLGHFYGIPVDVYGFCTDAHILDIQNGYERVLNAIIPVLAGADEISGIGEMEGGVSSSFAQIVIDDEIISGIQRISNGLKLDDERLGVNLIDKIMDGPRNFLSEKHTLKYLREGEIIHPKLAARDSWSQWEKTARSSIVARAAEKADSLVKESSVQSLEKDQIAELENVIQTFNVTKRLS